MERSQAEREEPAYGGLFSYVPRGTLMRRHWVCIDRLLYQMMEAAVLLL